MPAKVGRDIIAGIAQELINLQLCSLQLHHTDLLGFWKYQCRSFCASAGGGIGKCGGAAARAACERHRHEGKQPRQSPERQQQGRDGHWHHRQRLQQLAAQWDKWALRAWAPNGQQSAWVSMDSRHLRTCPGFSAQHCNNSSGAQDNIYHPPLHIRSPRKQTVRDALADTAHYFGFFCALCFDSQMLNDLHRAGG